MGYACAAGVPAIKAFVTAHNMTAPDLLRSARTLANGIQSVHCARSLKPALALRRYFWQRMASEVLPKLNRTLYVWATNDLSNLDPSVVPAGSVFNMYTDLGSTLNTTAVRGVPAILSAPYCER